jgi:hypothetical protein
MLIKTKLTNLICAVTIGSYVGLANASDPDQSQSGCSDKQLEKFYNLMLQKDISSSNHDPIMVEKFQMEMEKMPQCVIRHKEQTREEAGKVRDKIKKDFSK